MSIMAVLSRKQVKYLDKLFYDVPALAQAVEEIRSMEQTAAEQSSDPTAKTAAVNLEPVPAVLGYENPERWLEAVQDTWQRYGSDTPIGKCMRRRYKLHESAETTAAKEAIGVGTYFYWRNEFLLYAAFTAIKNGCRF